MLLSYMHKQTHLVKANHEEDNGETMGINLYEMSKEQVCVLEET